MGAHDSKRSADAEHTIRWVLTHEPIALFEEAAERFCELVAEGSSGRIAVSVMTPTEYGQGTRMPPLEVARHVGRGEIEMAQTYTVALGQLHEKLWALDLPFLFDSHDHASAVLDGRIGRELLDGLQPAGLRGLGFTYSGGYRIISTLEKQLREIDDLRGIRLRTSENPVVTTLFTELGAEVHPAPLWKIPEMTEKGEIDAAESTWPRYWDMGHHNFQGVVSETGHSLFLTALVINDRFYQSLTPDLREVLQSAALRVAALERKKSVDDAVKARAAFVARGGTVVTPTAAATKRFEEASRFVHERFAPRFGADLIERIRQTPPRAAF